MTTEATAIDRHLTAPFMDMVTAARSRPRTP
jgi:hypothetical protein